MSKAGIIYCDGCKQSYGVDMREKLLKKVEEVLKNAGEDEKRFWEKWKTKILMK